MRMRWQVWLARTFSTEYFFFLKWNSVEILQHPRSSSCGHYLQPWKNLWPLPNWAQDLTMRRLSLFGVGIEHPGYWTVSHLHWNLCPPSLTHTLPFSHVFSLQSIFLLFSCGTDILFSAQCHSQHLEIEQAAKKWSEREEITVLTSVAWPETSKCFSHLNRLSQKTAG